jgi:prepilin signal peptidase PulO-like enzyme (type II secretory pathway)
VVYLNFIPIFLFGLIIGSFISAYSYRWPRNISVQKGRSFCPKCKNKISWYDNIPLLSYALLRGKCRNCKNKISSRYPLIELLTALLFVAVYTFKGLSLQGSLALPYFLIISATLVAIFVIDLENKLIPDEAVFLIFLISFFTLLLSSNPAFYEILFSAFLASTFFLLLNLITRGHGMGLGDVKLVLALGLVLADPRMLLVWLFLSFTIGAVIGIYLIIIGKAKLGKQIPFGPFLIASFFITLFWGETLTGLLLPYL